MFAISSIPSSMVTPLAQSLSGSRLPNSQAPRCSVRIQRVLRGRKFRWIWRRQKTYLMRSEAVAKTSYQRQLRQRSARYDRLPVGASIMPCAKQQISEAEVIVEDFRGYRPDVPCLPWWPEEIKAAQKITHYTFNDGRSLARIRYGDEEWGSAADEHSCHDCAVIKGQYHVGPNCAVEQCPRCSDALANCDCDFASDDAISERPGKCEGGHSLFRAGVSHRVSGAGTVRATAFRVQRASGRMRV
jgi:hypothetical protein